MRIKQSNGDGEPISDTMSMRNLEVYDQSGSPTDESWLDDEIQKELSRIGSDELNDSEDQENEESFENNGVNTEEVENDPSMEYYLSYIQNQAKNLEVELQECDEVLEQANIISSRDIKTDEYLEDLAKQEGLTTNKLKHQILEDISNQEEQDSVYMREIEQEANVAPEKEENKALPLPDATSYETNLNSVLTVSDINSSEKTAEDQPASGITAESDMTVALITVEDDTKEQITDNQRNAPIHSDNGTIAEITEADLLEKAMWKQLKSLEDKYKQREDNRTQERCLLREIERKQAALVEEKRNEKINEIKLEQERLRKEQQEKEVRLQEEAEAISRRMECSRELHQRELEKLTAEAKEEKEQLLANQRQHDMQLLQKKTSAAANIQRHYRGYRVRKQYGKEINDRIKELRIMREQQRIAEIEGLRHAEIEEKERLELEERAHAEAVKLKEEEEKKKAEEERKKQEEEKKKQEEEEKKKQEEEIRKRNEAIRKDQETRKQEEENKRLEEEKKQLEEEKKRKEAERLRKEEEEKKKRKEIERKRSEAEKARLEEEKLLREEEEKRKRLEEEMLEKAIKEQARQNQLEGEMKDKSDSVIEASQLVTSGTSGQPSVNSLTPVPPKNSDRRPASAKQSKQTVNPVRKSRAFLTTLQLPRAWGESLPGDLDQQRIRWIKDCIAWSKVLGELRTRRLPINKKPPRRPISGKRLPLLDASLILSAAKVSALQQVTTVELSDLPGCNLRTLAECTQLKAIVMQNCHVITTDGIQMCKSLHYIDFQHNQIEVITCKDLMHLVYLDLSNNVLTSIHGLEGCHKLKYLNLAHNRITRIGGIDHLQSLHTLDLSHNQLITSKGLSAAATIQELNLSHNHLTSTDDLDRLGLLQMLDVTGNTLLQIPRLYNQVLLHSLLLNENDVADMLEICNYWLPMLYSLRLSQNNITKVPHLTNLLLLEELDVSNNQLLELENIIPGLVSLRRLKHLLSDGNPVTEENDWRPVVQDKLLRLEQLDGVQLTKRLPDLPQTKYEMMCYNQLQQHLEMKNAYKLALSSAADVYMRSVIHTKYFTQSYNLATEHRYSHEYGEISAVTSISFDFAAPKRPITPQPQNSPDRVIEKSVHQTEPSSSAEAAVNEVKSRTVGSDVELDSMLMEHEQKIPLPPKKAVSEMKRQYQSETINMKSKFEAMLSGAGAGTSASAGQNTLSGSEVSDHDSVAVRDVMSSLTRHKTTVPASKVGEALKQEGFAIHSSREHSAATKIQALWRGYMLRKRLQYALTYARQQEDGEDDSDMEYGEVDLNAFTFNEDDIEKDWLPPEVPQIPSSHPVIRHPLEAAVCSKPPHPPSNPKQVWRATAVTSGDHGQDHHQFSSGKPPLPPLSRLSNHTSDTMTEGAHTYRSKLTKREEKITEEWGFKDSRTAELMIQRARKLKYNAVKKKKLGQLDPKQRLALFRKLQETTKIRPVVPTKKTTERKEYFHAREEEEKKQGDDKFQEKQIKEARTYEWIHTQVGQFEVTSSRIQHREPERVIQPTQQSPVNKRVPVQLYNHDGNLPKMDPSILAGGRTLLTGSPMSMELQSVDSKSEMSDMARSRRISLPRTDSESDCLPPIKTSSAPSSRPEKMSWRNKEVNKSIGWGGGKKRGNVNY